MGYMIVYLVKTYNIPTTFVVNDNQTRLYLVPTTREWTWETMDAKHIKVLGIEDKK
jgi:hypothetical protein